MRYKIQKYFRGERTQKFIFLHSEKIKMKFVKFIQKKNLALWPRLYSKTIFSDQFEGYFKCHRRKIFGVIHRFHHMHATASKRDISIELIV